MTGWTLVFTLIGVSVCATKFVDLVESIGTTGRRRKRPS